MREGSTASYQLLNDEIVPKYYQLLNDEIVPLFITYSNENERQKVGVRVEKVFSDL